MKVHTKSILIDREGPITSVFSQPVHIAQYFPQNFILSLSTTDYTLRIIHVSK